MKAGGIILVVLGLWILIFWEFHWSYTILALIFLFFGADMLYIVHKNK
ncbi:MAG: hypothetical protein ACOCWO_00965 [Candidatus Muiribacteriaceae bacterium]